MRKILTASKDTTLYQAFSTINAGLDEIIEVGKVVDTTVDGFNDTVYESGSARILIDFDLPTTASIFSGSSFFLNLRLANVGAVKRNQEIIIYKISGSWDEGSGFFYQNIKNNNDGATWKQAKPHLSWSYYGGDFLTSKTSQSVTLSSYPLEDIRVDVTSLLQPIVSQSLQSTFYGLALQFPESDELDYENQGNIKIFSTQTHTVHQPTLEIVWDSQTFVTGSLQAIPSLNVKVVPSNLRQSYALGDVDRINLVVRDQYPLRSFDSTLRYKNRYYLPRTSYYSIVDTQSNTIVMPFDEYNKINTDSTGSYIILDTTPLYKGRYYTIKIKIVSGDYSRIVDTKTLFKID